MRERCGIEGNVYKNFVHIFLTSIVKNSENKKKMLLLNAFALANVQTFLLLILAGFDEG